MSCVVVELWLGWRFDNKSIIWIKIWQKEVLVKEGLILKKQYIGMVTNVDIEILVAEKIFSSVIFYYKTFLKQNVIFF